MDKDTTPRELMLAWLGQHASEYPEPAPGRTPPVVMAAISYAVARDIPAPAAWSALSALGLSVAVKKRRALWSSCQRYVAESSADSADLRRRLTLARRLVGRVLSPVDSKLAQPASTAALRRLFAVICLDQMASGYEAVHVSPDRHALRMGTTQRGMQNMIAKLVKIGWIRHTRTLRSGAKLYRVCRLDSAGAATAEMNADTVDALALGEQSTELARVLASADHPAWGYAAPSPRTWMVIVADAAGLSAHGLRTYAQRLGARVPQIALREMRAFASVDLDVSATRAGAYETIAERERELEERWRADRAKRAELTAQAAVRRAARKVIYSYAGQLAPHASKEGQRAWAGALRAGLAGEPQTAEMSDAIAGLVVADLVGAGMDEVKAEAIARAVVGAA